MEHHRKRKVMILGCTGSIGTTALKALQTYANDFTIAALHAHTSIRELAAISHQWNCRTVCISQEESTACDELFPEGTTIYRGRKGLLQMISDTEADVVLNGISGASGLEPTFSAIDSGKDIALSNKESIVMAGKLLFAHAQQHQVRILPVDSEHSTLSALIDAHGLSSVSSLVLTASGGPFRTLKRDELQHITVDMAVAHPNWSMGAKISIDSATLANKGLEVIEAYHLFGFSRDAIEVVIHPQSIVHSLIRLHNGAVYAQMTPPDIALPIMSALAERGYALRQVVQPLDFTNLTLQFESPDYQRFPLLKAAFETLERQGSYAIAYNAANEIAVSHFMRQQLRFDQIAPLVLHTLEQDWTTSCTSLDEIIAIDHRVRLEAERIARDMN
jgi:1-deoxy-D-xylulose-5-phosphate reductoisomerase